MTEGDASRAQATEQPAPARFELTAGGRLLRMTETAAHAFGARLCFAEPVHHADRTVIPVASVFSAGGLGFGSQPDAASSREGGGGGGALGASPVGLSRSVGQSRNSGASLPPPTSFKWASSPPGLHS